MNLFDYLFYRIYLWQKKRETVLFPVNASIVTTSLFPILNVFTILLLLRIVEFPYSSAIWTMYGRIIGLIPILIVYFHFLKNKHYLVIIDKYDRISIEYRKRKDFLILAYIFLSVLIFFIIVSFSMPQGPSIEPLPQTFGRSK
jgi:hypothetical protein